MMSQVLGGIFLSDLEYRAYGLCFVRFVDMQDTAKFHSNEVGEAHHLPIIATFRRGSDEPRAHTAVHTRCAG